MQVARGESIFAISSFCMWYLLYFTSCFPHCAFTLFGEVVKNGKQGILPEIRRKRKLSFSLDFGQILIFSANDLHRHVR